MISNSQLNNSLESFLSDTLEKGFFLEYEIFKFMFITGCRFAEVQNKGDWYLSPDGRLYFDTVKNGGRRNIPLNDELIYIKASATDNENYHMPRNYPYYLTFFQRRYLYSDARIGKKRVGLHVFRHNRARQKFQELGSIDQVTDFFKLSSNFVTGIYINSLIE